MHSPTDSMFAAPEGASLPALRLVQSPRRLRRFARWLMAALALSLLGALVVPWQQSVAGGGQVVAFDPLLRPQTIEASVEGRIAEWYDDLKEGDYKRKGDRLLRIEDNDPELSQRLDLMVELASQKVMLAEQKVVSYQEQLDLFTTLKDGQISIAEFERDAAQQKLHAEVEMLAAHNQSLELAKQVFERTKRLRENPRVDQVVSLETFQTDQTKYEQAKAYVQYSQEIIEAIRAELNAKESKVGAASAEYEAKIAKAATELQNADSDLRSARESAAKAERDRQRFAAQEITAPANGRVVRLVASQGALGRMVKPGDPLIFFVPDCAEPAAEVWVDGNDMPLIQPGSHVRLQFEGYPAVQFVGWPSAAVGTFGGEVALVDATGNGKGQFRVLVRPQVLPGEEPWPDMRWLPQGSRAHGWVLLNRVPLGYEIWRRLNGFPPVLADDAPAAGKSTTSKGAKN